MSLPAGYRLVELRRIDSTNAEALRRAADGAPHGTVVVAADQTVGRGRRGRSWISAPGNLFMTVLVRPPEGSAVAQLSFVAAVALGDALPPGTDFRFKWPNDVLLVGRKLAGILIEADGGAAAVGIGVNTASTPEAVRGSAADLACACDAPQLAGDVCGAFDLWYRRWLAEGFGPVREAWLRRAAGLGQEVATGSARGRFARLTEDGALVLVDASGAATEIAAGEVFFGRHRCC
ncbi:MAG: biotin--[acetyl-CoA-carboxylase] ligase [Defluviicoccus sp.]|nr:biotin--[acetyl-CoA-carboxylase] ligase [Defluviicoccus sp.]MDE0385674.1 biotin--[acetyl-CoA-carboxylase] ligase [Defluviicoccus sp.]